MTTTARVLECPTRSRPLFRVCWQWLGDPALANEIARYIDQLGHRVGLLLPLQCAFIAGEQRAASSHFHTVRKRE